MDCNMSSRLLTGLTAIIHVLERLPEKGHLLQMKVYSRYSQPKIRLFYESVVIQGHRFHA